jgi:transcriptional regulator with XRE-family HTH domain
MSSAIRCASNRIGAATVASVDIVSRSLRQSCSHRQQQNVDVANISTGAVLASGRVAGRPIFHKEFGVFLAKLREEKTGWSQSDAARFGAKHSPLLTRQVILHLEAGKTKDPEPEVLRALATLYGVPYEDIARRFIAQRYSIRMGDLIRHSNDQGSAVRGFDVAAQARVLSAATELVEASEAFARTVQDVASRLRGDLANTTAQHTAGAPGKKPSHRVRAS